MLVPLFEEFPYTLSADEQSQLAKLVDTISGSVDYILFFSSFILLSSIIFHFLFFLIIYIFIIDYFTYKRGKELDCSAYESCTIDHRIHQISNC